MNNKDRGYDAEELVAQDYVKLGYEIIDQNWTIRGGELDLVIRDEESDLLIFVEVKLVSGMIDDVLGYVVPSKLRSLKRSIECYLIKHPEYSSLDLRVDVVFVDQNGIQERCKNVYLS